MKKTLPLLVVFVLVLSGFGTSIASEDNHIKNKPRNIKDLGLEIVVKGGLFGYTITVKNMGTEQVDGTFIIQIMTDASIMFIGKSPEDGWYYSASPDESKVFKLKPVIGFGPAAITIEALFMISDDEIYYNTAETTGYVIIFFIRCNDTSIILAP